MGRIQSFLDSVGTWFISALVFLIPLFFIPVSWVTIPHAKVVIVAIAVLLAIGAWALARIASDSITIPVSFIALSALALPILYGTSALLAGTGATSFVGVGTEVDTVSAMVLWVAGLVGAMFLTYGMHSVHRIYTLIMLSAGAVALWHLVQIIFGDAVTSLGGILALPPASVLGSWHDLAIFLGLAAFLSALYTTVPFATRLRIALAVGVSALSLAVLVLINARDVWTALAILSTLTVFYLLFLQSKARKPSIAPVTPENPIQPTPTNEEARQPQTQSSERVSFVAPLIVAVVAIVFAVAGSFLYDRIPEQIRVVELEVRPSWEGTFAVGSAVYQEKGFLFGSGPNTFTRQWGLYKPAGVNETAFWNTDFTQGIGFIPTSVITAGILGALAWILFLGMILLRGFWSLFPPVRDGDGRWRLLLLALFGGVTYMWAFHLIYPPGVALLALTFLLTGLFIAAQHSAGMLRTMTVSFAPANVRGVISIAVVAIVALVVIFAGFFLLRSASADMLVNRSVSVFNETNNVELAQRVLGRAAILDPNNRRVHRAGVELGLLEFQSVAQRGLETPEDEQKLRSVLEQAITHGLTAVSIDESDYRSWITLARLYEELAGVQIRGAYENAQDAYERALGENPTNPEPLVRLAQLSLSQGNVEDASSFLDLAIARKNNYAVAHFLRSQVEAQQGNMATAIEAAQAAAAFAPQEPLAWFQLGVLQHGNGNFEQAAVVLEQAVILNGNYANALYVLGLVYYEIGRTEDSIAAFERVQTLNPGNQLLEGILTNLQSGQAPLAEIEE